MEITTSKLMEPPWVYLDGTIICQFLMVKLEQEFLRTQDAKPREWWRFIDDIFALWTNGESSSCNFIESAYHQILPPGQSKK